MRFQRAGSVNMHHLVSVRDQPVRNQHAMAVEVYALGAHVRGTGSLGHRDQIGHRLLELRGQRVIGVVAKARIAERNVRRVFAAFLAIASQGFHPHITDSGCGQSLFQGFSIELRQPPRHGECADIHQRFNRVRLKRPDQVLDGAGRMSDSVEESQRCFDARTLRNDAVKSRGHGNILRRKNGSQIQHHAAFFDSRNDRRI